MGLNNWTGVGNLTRDPELRYTQGANQTAVCRMSIAINDGYGDKQETNYINIVVFGKQAESCNQYLSKGKKIGVNGRIKTGSYVSQKTGEKVYTTDVVANHVEFLSPSNQQAQGFQQQAGYQQAYQPQQGFGQQNGFQQPTGFGQQAQGFGQPPAQQMAPQAAPPQPAPQQAAQQQAAPEQIEGFAALQDDDIPF